MTAYRVFAKFYNQTQRHILRDVQCKYSIFTPTSSVWSATLNVNDYNTTPYEACGTLSTAAEASDWAHAPLMRFTARVPGSNPLQIELAFKVGQTPYFNQSAVLRVYRNPYGSSDWYSHIPRTTSDITASWLEHETRVDNKQLLYRFRMGLEPITYQTVPINTAIVFHQQIIEG